MRLVVLRGKGKSLNKIRTRANAMVKTPQVNLNLVLNEDDSNFYKNVLTTKILDDYIN